jgi:transposase InsO family protein
MSIGVYSDRSCRVLLVDGQEYLPTILTAASPRRARFYFLLSFVDAYSRYIVHHKLLMRLDGKSVAVELQAALEAVKDAKPRVVHDHGSEFVNRDVAAVIKTHNLIDIKTRARHPESNGIVEQLQRHSA